MNKTRLIVFAGLFAGLSAVVASVAGYFPIAATLAFVSIAAILSLLAIIHRYLVRTNQRNRKWKKSRADHIEERLIRMSAKVDQVLDEFDESTEQIESLREEVHSVKSDPSEKRAVASEKPASQTADTLKAEKRSRHPHRTVDPKFPPLSPASSFAAIIKKDPRAMETFALVNRSTSIRNSFALAASGNELGIEELFLLMEQMRSRNSASVYSRYARLFSVAPLLALARIIANQRSLQDDLERAELLFYTCYRLFGLKSFGNKDIYLYAEILQELGFYEAAFEVYRETGVEKKDKVQLALVKANAVVAKADDWPVWLSVMNELYSSRSLLPIALDTNSSSPIFDQVTNNGALARTVDGPLVSVLIPTYEGANRITTALDSLINQTWKNIEIIVIDDGSSEENLSKLREICANYRDVRLIEQGKNLGAYPARNLGLKVAHGQYVTVHDDDDWSHAQKIELQAESLEADSSLDANMSKHVRATESLTFVRINKNPMLAQKNMSSLMFRREVFANIGVWDEVNRGGDAEFFDRLKRIGGGKVKVVSPVPLSFTRTHKNSLTSGELQRGYMDPARRFYHAAYLKKLRDWRQTGKRPAGNAAVPVNMLPGRRNESIPKLDVLVTANFANDCESTSFALAEVRALASEGKAVGMANLFSAGSPESIMLTDEALAVAALPGVSPISLTSRVDTRLVIAHDPCTLQNAEGVFSNVSAEQAVLILDQKSRNEQLGGSFFDLQTILYNSKRIFGVHPEVRTLNEGNPGITGGPSTRNIAGPQDWPLLGVDFEISETDPLTNELPIVAEPQFGDRPGGKILGGEYESFAILSEEDSRQLEAAVGRLLGGSPGVDETAANALRKISFLVLFPPKGSHPSLYNWVLVAQKYGIIVILPKEYECYYGQSVVYCSEEDVEESISRILEIPYIYQKQKELAQNFSDRMMNADEFVHLTMNLGSGEAQ
ncbi:glycosyltransferase family A protein [Corynebacterium tuberculostearicum]|uniref:glycosyltransferase family 2 protein n=1 Tax=Corynebacterium tuberculostearicum TaxID=38304 RepID=UPI002934AC5A|nr:glycosyltransferase family A protein [Corynebacterium tuberculostearicum]MDV2431453.1 glycosyltransferase family A protein [Corynebacterium tuberculostearicum]